jgi:Spy/CpxP family protein refolding chaperone
MKGKLIFKLGALSMILSVLMVVPVMGQTDEELGKQLKEYKTQIFDQLKFNPDQKEALLALEAKYAAKRGENVDALKKSLESLKAGLAAPNPDEAKVKELVSAFIAAQTNLFGSFKGQLDEELAQMGPVQQGKYLLAMETWRQRCMPKVCIPTSK